MPKTKSSKTSKLPVKTPPKTKCSGCPLIMDELEFDRGLWCSGDCGGFWCEGCWSDKEMLTFPYDDEEDAYCVDCLPTPKAAAKKSKSKKSALIPKERTCSSCKHVMSAAEYEKGEWCSGNCEGYFCQKCSHDDKRVTVLDRGDAYCADCCPLPKDQKLRCGGCRLSVNKKENAKAFKQMKLCGGGCGKYFCKECCKDFGANDRCKGCTEAANPKTSASAPPKVNFNSYDLLLAQQAQLAHELLELRKRIVNDPRHHSKNDEKVTAVLKCLEDDMKPVRAFLKLGK